MNGAPNDDADGAGAAYIFVRTANGWSQQAYLKANNLDIGDLFGSSVAISGDTVVVGAGLEDSSTTEVNSPPNNDSNRSGAAYVFVRNAGVWTQQAYLKGSHTDADDFFGTSVDVSGDTIIVAAGGDDSSTSGVNSTPNNTPDRYGAAYVFVRSAGNWTQQAYLKSDNPDVGDQFAVSVAISGDTALVGANLEDSSTTGVNGTPNEDSERSGAAYVFVGNAGTWTQQANGKFENLDDFARRLDTKAVNKKILESLIRCGAFDFGGEDRAHMISRIAQVATAAAIAQKDRSSGQISLFGDMEVDFGAPPPKLDAEGEVIHATPMSKDEKFTAEKELLGFYVTGHPLDAYACTARSCRRIPAGTHRSSRRR